MSSIKNVHLGPSTLCTLPDATSPIPIHYCKLTLSPVLHRAFVNPTTATSCKQEPKWQRLAVTEQSNVQQAAARTYTNRTPTLQVGREMGFRPGMRPEPYG